MPAVNSSSMGAQVALWSCNCPQEGLLTSTCIFRDLWQQRGDEEEIREWVDAVHLIVCFPRDDVVGAPSHDGQQEWWVIQC